MRIFETTSTKGQPVYIIRAEEWPLVGHRGDRAQPKPFELAYLRDKVVRLTAVSVVVQRDGETVAFVSIGKP